MPEGVGYEMEMEDDDGVGVEAVVMEYLAGMSKSAQVRIAQQILQGAGGEAPEGEMPMEADMGDADMDELAMLMGEEDDEMRG